MPEVDSKLQQNDILNELKPGEKTIESFPDGGYLFLEHDVPYMFIYRKKEEDLATLRLTRSGASYLLIGEKPISFYNKLIIKITEKMSEKFSSFLLLEFYSGSKGSKEFVIKGPSEKLPASLTHMKEGLEKIDSRRSDLKLSVKLKDTKVRHAPSEEPLASTAQLKLAGGALVGIEIPPVYKNEDGNIFPIYFRKFRDEFIYAIQTSIFEFVRVQTTCGLHSYKALGKRDIHTELHKIDRQITKIQSSYQFLMLVAPVNIQRIRERFFKSNFKELEKYHYRLLPVDPDLLKRELYDLRIDEIDDPAMAFLYDEKREEVEQELSMLKERGSKNFFYSSVRLYGSVEQDLLKEAQRILSSIEEDNQEDEKETITAEEFKVIAQNEFDYFKSQAQDFKCKVHIRNDVNVIMVSMGELYIPSDYQMTKLDSKALIQHEIGTHVLSYFNGSKQPLSQLAIGLADYDALQEGLAVLAEYLAGAVSKNRMRILAGRVVAGAALFEGCDFKEVFHLLFEEYNFSKERAFNITSRMFQGGGFLKDIIYLKGLWELKKHLNSGGELKGLLAGKFAVKHINTIKELTERGLLIPPTILPRYMYDRDFESRLNKFKQGQALANMIEQ